MPSDIEHIGFAPPHPGEILREDVLPGLKMNVTELARHLGVTRQTLSGLLNEKRALSLEMAQKLGQAFENGTRFWLALQMQHDIWLAEKSDRPEIKPIRWNEENAA
jgi:antitoxin HigA-1